MRVGTACAYDSANHPERPQSPAQHICLSVAMLCAHPQAPKPTRKSSSGRCISHAGDAAGSHGFMPACKRKNWDCRAQQHSGPHLVVETDPAGVGCKHSIGQELSGVCYERLRERRPRQDRSRPRIAHAGHKHQLALSLQRQQTGNWISSCAHADI